jgi:predicted DNA-binding ribbon-helix-helix protein
MPATTVNLDGDVYDWIKEEAWRRRVSMARLINEILRSASLTVQR